MLYQDVPLYWLIASNIQKLTPKSVFQPCCGCGNVLWRLSNAEIPVRGIEGSVSHYLSRISNGIHFHNIVPPWPVQDKEYDLVFSALFLSKNLFHLYGEEIKRVANRGYHIIDPSSFNLDEARSLLGPDHIVVDWNNILSTTYALNFNRGVIKINLGSGKTMYNFGWINMDKESLFDHATPYSYNFYKHDLTVPFKEVTLASNKVTVFVAHHLLNFLTESEGRRLLQDCFDTLVPGGMIRLSVLDFERFDYQSLDNIGYFENQKIRSVWHADGLINVLNELGYNDVKIKGFLETDSKSIKTETFDTFPDFSIHIEAKKFVL